MELTDFVNLHQWRIQNSVREVRAKGYSDVFGTTSTCEPKGQNETNVGGKNFSGCQKAQASARLIRLQIPTISGAFCAHFAFRKENCTPIVSEKRLDCQICVHAWQKKLTVAGTNLQGV